MFAERNGLKSLLRTPFRSGLFFLLIIFLSSILILSLVLFSSIRSFLEECQEAYHTIGVLEYLGERYPEAKVYDERLETLIQSEELDLEALTKLDGVLSFDQGISELGMTDAQRLDKYVYERGLGVIVIDNLMWDNNGETYMAVIRDVLYSQRDHKGKLVFIDPGAFPHEDIRSYLTKGNSYILVGRYVDGASSYLWFSPSSTDFVLDGKTVHVEGWKQYESEGSYAEYEAAAEIFRIQNSSFRLVYTTSVEDLKPFSEEELTLSEGRFFTEEEKRNGNAAILSDRASLIIGKTLGDQLSFSLYDGTDGLYTISTLDASREKTVTITGIYNATDAYPDWVFLSEAKAFDKNYVPTGFSLGQFRLDNDKADAFYQTAKELLPKNFRLTIYDQGYSLTAGPYKELLLAIGFFFLLAFLLTLALLFLYGFLLVMKDKTSIETMHMLGTGKVFIYRYFLFQTTVLTLLASLLGGILAKTMESRANALVRSFSSFRNQDLRFSQSLLGHIKTMEFNPQTSLWIYGLGILLSLLVAFLAVFYFLYKVFQKKNGKKTKRKTLRQKALKGSVLYGKGKYPLLSLKRNLLKTSSVTLVLVSSFLFIGILHGLTLRYEEKKAEVKASTVLRGYASSITGLDFDNLVVPVHNIRALQETGLLDSLAYGRKVSNYRIVGVRQKADGTLLDVEKPYIPETSFAMETFLAQLAKEPDWIAVSDVRSVPEFFYSDSVSVDFLDGYSFDSFLKAQPDICLLPESVGERLGLQKGDVIRVLTYPKKTVGIQLYDLLIVGFFQSEGVKENLYTPFDANLFGVELEEGTPWPNYIENAPLSGSVKNGKAYQVEKEEDLPEAYEIYGDYSKEDLLSAGSNVCLVESTYLKAYAGITKYNRYKANPSSKMYITVSFEDGASLPFLVIGEYQGEGDGTVLYSRCNTTYSLYQSDYDYDFGNGSPFSLRFALFTFSDMEKLDELREELSNSGFVHPGSHDEIRVYSVIEDRDYLTTIASFDRQIKYMKALSAFLYTALFAVSYVLAFLLIGGRREEVGIMRSLGTQKRIIFWSFVGEQLLLVLLTLGASIVLNGLLWGFQPMVLALSLVFSGLWLLGAAVKMVGMLRLDVREFFIGEE